VNACAVLRGHQEARQRDQRDYFTHTLPIGIAGLMLFVAGLTVETPRVLGDYRTVLERPALSGSGGFGGRVYRYFFAAQTTEPDHPVVVFIIFPVFAVIIGAWYEGQALSQELMIYSAILLTGFAITKIACGKWLKT